MKTLTFFLLSVSILLSGSCQESTMEQGTTVYSHPLLLDGEGLDMVGTENLMFVPENRHKPDSRLIGVHFFRLPAKGESTLPPVFYLPGGRVHSIGTGLLLAEIQQTSDVTYRIYDFDRKDKNGNKRELHTDLALDAIDFSEAGDVKSHYERIPNQANSIVSSPYFSTNHLLLNQAKEINRSALDCFKIYICVKGKGLIANEAIQFGEVALVPACMKNYVIEPEGELELLETYIAL